MIRSVKDLKRFDAVATDGSIGGVDDVYFDDERWAIRYLVVDTGKWLPGRKVLISPFSVSRTEWGERRLLLSITREKMADLGGTNDDLEGLINFPLTVKDIEAVAFFKEIGDGDWRVSMRSKGNVDTGRIAREHGGGGHTNASGCAASGALDDVYKQFGELLTEAIRNR